MLIHTWDFQRVQKCKVEQEMWQMDARSKKLEENLGFILTFQQLQIQVYQSAIYQRTIANPYFHEILNKISVQYKDYSCQEHSSAPLFQIVSKKTHPLTKIQSLQNLSSASYLLQNIVSSTEAREGNALNEYTIIWTLLRHPRGFW